MKRKLILLVGCFLLLLLAFGTYRFFLPDAVGTTGQSVRTMLDWGKIDPDRPTVGRSQGVRFFDINSEGALRGIYRADALSKEDDGSWTLQAPTAEVHLPDNKRVYISADRGRLWAQEVADGFDVRRGTMEGNVKIYYDQSTDYERLHPKERMEKDWDAFRNEVMTISTSNVEFSRHMLELYTPDRVDVWSKEVNLHGRDLRIQWNESPRELRELKLAVVDKLIIKQMPQPMDPLPLESNDAAESPDENTQAARSKIHPQTQLAYYPASSQLVYQPDDLEDAWNLPDAPPEGDEHGDAATTDEVDTDAEEEDEPAESVEDAATTQAGPTEDTEPESGRPSGTPVRPEAGEQQQAVHKARNIYQATCTENVRVTSRQDNASIIGAEEVSWTFEWSDSWRGDEEDEETPTDDEAAEASQESVEPDDAETPEAASPSDEREITPADREDKQDNRMEIHCDGPLVIRPVGATDNPSSDHYILAGHGERVILNSDRGRALCKSFSYDNAREQITIAGNSKVPSRLLLANGDEIICRDEIEVFGKQEKAYGRGPGTMNHFEETTREDAWESVLAGEADQRQIDAQIYWAGGVEVAFGSEIVTREDGGSERELFFKKATFDKRVQLARRAMDEQGRKTQSFDHVKCDHLTAIIDRADTGEPYISRADATGNVAGRWSGAEFTTREATLYLEPAPPEPTDQPDDADEPKTADTETDADGEDDDTTLGFTGLAKMQLRRMLANGDVYVRQQGRATIKAQSVNMTRGEGPEAPWSIDADGKGELQFSTKRGMGGEEYDVPRHVRIRWAKRMDFDGSENLATFEGDIRFDSGDDTMAAEKMLLYLADAEPEDEPNAQASPEATDDPLLAMGVGDIASRDLSRIEIIGDPDGPAESKQAVLNRTRFDPAMPQVVLQRMELRGERVIYIAGHNDAESPQAATPSIVEVIGAGQFSHEDYQPLTEEEKEQAKAEGSDPMDLAGQRPSQTACKWQGRMKLNQQTNHLRLEDSVTMVYRNGDKILKIKGLQTPIWKEMPKGRASTIRCDVLDSWFEEAKDTDGQAAPGTEMLEGVRAMGSLTRVEARKDVTMVDGPVTIDAQRILYDAIDQTVNVWGYAEGQPQSDARISRVNPDTGRTTPIASPFIKWVRPKGDRPEKIVTGKVSGGGGM